MTATLNTEPLGVQERADALALAALLRASLRALGVWSLGLSWLAVFVLMQMPVERFSGAPVGVVCWALVLLSGLMERYVAFRLSLDERLFQQLGHGQMPQLQALDTALAHLGLRKPAAAVRSLADRLRGARQLVHRHVVLVLLQTVATLASLIFLGFK